MAHIKLSQISKDIKGVGRGPEGSIKTPPQYAHKGQDGAELKPACKEVVKAIHKTLGNLPEIPKLLAAFEAACPQAAKGKGYWVCGDMKLAAVAVNKGETLSSNPQDYVQKKQTIKTETSNSQSTTQPLVKQFYNIYLITILPDIT